MSAEMASIARDNLFLMQSAWATLGVNLWCVEKIVMPVYPNQPTVTLPVGTLTVLNAMYRTLSRLDGAVSSAGGTASYATDGDTTTILTQTAPAGNVSVDAGGDTVVSTVGYLPGTTSTLQLVWEYSTDNSTWTTLLAVASANYTNGEWTWWDIAAPVSARYYRLRAVAGTIVAREIVFGHSAYEITMADLNQDQYVAMPNKQMTGQPLQFWLDRQRDQPVMYLWPVPSNTFAQIVVWRHRYIQDVGTAQNDLDVPQRWLDAVVTGLAARMAMELPGIPDSRIGMLESRAAMALQAVSDAESGTGPMQLVSNITVYTA
jgi:hypothetical protein